MVMAALERILPPTTLGAYRATQTIGKENIEHRMAVEENKLKLCELRVLQKFELTVIQLKERASSNMKVNKNIKHRQEERKLRKK